MSAARERLYSCRLRADAITQGFQSPIAFGVHLALDMCLR
jgi:hypothetical protein